MLQRATPRVWVVIIKAPFTTRSSQQATLGPLLKIHLEWFSMTLGKPKTVITVAPRYNEDLVIATQEGGGVSRQISGSLTERNVEISNFLMTRLLCSMLPRIQNI